MKELSKAHRKLGSYLSATIFIFYFLAAIVNADVLEPFSVLRYLNYLIPFIVIIVWVSCPQLRVYSRHEKYVIILYLSMLFPAVLGFPNSLKYIVFIGFGFLPFAFPLILPSSYVVRIFVMFCLFQLGLFFISGGQVRSLDIDSFSSGSESVTHTLPAIFGILFGFFMASGRYRMAILCFIMIVVSGKRSVLAASCLGLFGFLLDVFVLQRILGMNRRIINNLLVFFVFIFGFPLAINMPSIYEYISTTFDLNINVLTSGRYIGQSVAYSEFWNSGIFDLLFGRGLGTADHYAVIGFDGLATLLHCDYMRVIIDFGVPFGIVFVFCYFVLMGRNPFGSYLILWSAQLWTTENNIINVAVPLLVYLCQQSLKSDALFRSAVLRVSRRSD